MQLAALRQHVAHPAFADYWAPMNGLVGQLAGRRRELAFPKRLPMDWAFLMIGLVGQLAARRSQSCPPKSFTDALAINGH